MTSAVVPPIARSYMVWDSVCMVLRPLPRQNQVNRVGNARRVLANHIQERS
jgi:hypothetical protein